MTFNLCCILYDRLYFFTIGFFFISLFLNYWMFIPGKVIFLIVIIGQLLWSINMDMNWIIFTWFLLNPCSIISSHFLLVQYSFLLVVYWALYIILYSFLFSYLPLCFTFWEIFSTLSCYKISSNIYWSLATEL